MIPTSESTFRIADKITNEAILKLGYGRQAPVSAFVDFGLWKSNVTSITGREKMVRGNRVAFGDQGRPTKGTREAQQAEIDGILMDWVVIKAGATHS